MEYDVTCGRCLGTGEFGDGHDMCRKCVGSGTIHVKNDDPEPALTVPVEKKHLLGAIISLEALSNFYGFVGNHQQQIPLDILIKKLKETLNESAIKFAGKAHR